MKAKLTTEEIKHLEELKNYLGLENIEQAKYFEILQDELLKYGDWGNKILTYLKSILSRNKRYSSFIQQSDKDIYKAMLDTSLKLLDESIKENNKDKDDNI